MEISHDFLFSPKGSPFLPCSGWSDAGSGNYHHCLGTSLPVLQLPRVLCPAVCTTPPHSNLFPLPWPGAILFPIQQTAKPCAKKALLHFPLKTLIMLMFSTPFVSNNPLSLHCVPGCCTVGKMKFSLPQGGEEADMSSPAKHSTLLWGDGTLANSCHLALAVTAPATVTDGHSPGFHRKWPERYQLCCSVIFSNRWSSSPPGTGTGGTDIWAMTLQFSRITCLSLSLHFWKNPPALHVPEADFITFRAHIILSTHPIQWKPFTCDPRSTYILLSNLTSSGHKRFVLPMLFFFFLATTIFVFQLW